MRPATIVVFVVLAATSFAFAKTTTTIPPQSTGTIANYPAQGLTQWEDDDAHSSCFQTTPDNLKYRRGFLEFSVPSFNRKKTMRATLFIYANLARINPPPPPDVHEVSYYPADLVVDESDYDAPTMPAGSVETQGIGGLHEFALDVTDIVRQFEGSNLGFRIKLQIDPAGPCPGFAGAGFGGVTWPPKLVIEKGSFATVPRSRTGGQ